MLIKYHTGITNDRSSLSKKIENEIFDKSIEDIEKIFNFKINTDLKINESSLSSSSTLSNQRKRKSEDDEMTTTGRKKKFANTTTTTTTTGRSPVSAISSQLTSSSTPTTITNLQKNNISMTRNSQPILKSSTPSNIQQRVIRDSRIIVNSIYLQDFNLFRDDLLDELFELNESLRGLR